MQTRSFRGSGEPAGVNASSNACFRLGPDPRRALGPAAIPAASTGRTHDRTRPMLHQRKKLLSIKRRPHMTPTGHDAPLFAAMHVPDTTRPAILGVILASGEPYEASRSHYPARRC